MFFVISGPYLIEMDTCRIWQKVRVFITLESIVFADIGGESVIDQVPLHDVELVKDMSTVRASVDGKFQNAVIVKTVAHGHNGGRTYYLQAENGEECSHLVKMLEKLASEALLKVKAKTQFTRARLKARDIFSSPQFQMASAFLILTVN